MLSWCRLFLFLMVITWQSGFSPEIGIFPWNWVLMTSWWRHRVGNDVIRLEMTSAFYKSFWNDDFCLKMSFKFLKTKFCNLIGWNQKTVLALFFASVFLNVFELNNIGHKYTWVAQTHFWLALAGSQLTQLSREICRFLIGRVNFTKKRILFQVVPHD